jgi:putative transposase
LVAKHQTRWTGFDDKIISLYARGLSVREIQGHLEEMYGTEVSPILISTVTDAVSEDVKLWQCRPLDPLHPILYLDGYHLVCSPSRLFRSFGCCCNVPRG